jgi:hypothetical protein
MRLTLSALENMGVYAHPIKTWRDKPNADRTWDNFVPHFEHGEKERVHLLTATNAGYYSVNTAVIHGMVTPSPICALAATPTIPTQFQYNNCPLYYCWTHGLNQNPKHNSANNLLQQK